MDLADNIPTERETTHVNLLVGNEYFLEIIHGKKIEVCTGLYLLASKLGCILSGRTNENCDVRVVKVQVTDSLLWIGHYKVWVFTSLDSSLPDTAMIEDPWKVESIRIIDEIETPADDIAMRNFRDTLKFVNGRYEVTRLWKKDTPDLPTNKELALGRSTVNRLKSKP
ncbi:hypothetical protein DPMN_013588 [Dreissena polymorpha]|uniref:Uncharacterized protein n=1 Tax=Dreissena polymorpha TaxID=45954 RepID=A0A9D4S3T5_DREPO|nr:hypothetical protein DPMN_013588 [Dreissena polymorpha]